LRLHYCWCVDIDMVYDGIYCDCIIVDVLTLIWFMMGFIAIALLFYVWPWYGLWWEFIDLYYDWTIYLHIIWVNNFIITLLFFTGMWLKNWTYWGVVFRESHFLI
jgi:hypothetical protein